MTRDEYLTEFQVTYQPVTVLVNKEDHAIYRFRHRTLGRDIVLRSYRTPLPVYEALTEIRSPYLPEVYDAIALDDGMIVLEEFISGITVAESITAEKCTPDTAFGIVKNVCYALSALHAINIVHRDIKPENIILDDHGRVVLIDFNAARRISIKSKDTAVLGTVGYASPEQFGLAQSDMRTDIYAAGILLNVLLTGTHPSERLATGRAERIIRKCTQINPDDRYQTAKKLAAAL